MARRSKALAVSALAALSLAAAWPGPAFAEALPHDSAFARGAYEEEFRGDLKAAAGEYEKVLSSSAAPSDLRIEAILRLGLCLEKAGDRQGAERLAARVLSDPLATASHKAKAALLSERLETAKGVENLRSQVEYLAEENFKLRKDLGRLEDALKEARERGDEASKREHSELLGKIAKLQDEIEAREKERGSLQSRIERLTGMPKDGSSAAVEAENAMKIIEKLEHEKEIQREEREFLAGKYYDNGVRFKNLGEYDKAVENLRLCLEILPDHPKARMQVLVVEALLGGAKSADDAPPDVIAEIERQVWIAQKRIALENSFSDGMACFRTRDFARAVDLFKRVTDIICSDLRMPNEFEKRLSSARRYMTLARAERDNPRPPRWDSPVVAEIELFSFPGSDLSAVMAGVDPEFRKADPLGTIRSFAAWAELDPVQGGLLSAQIESTGIGRSAGKSGFILENGVDESYERLADAGKPAGSVRYAGPLGQAEARYGLEIRIKPSFDRGRSTVRLEITVVSSFPGQHAVKSPSRTGTVQIPIVLSQAFRIAADAHRGNSVIIAGVMDPFSAGNAAGAGSGVESGNLLVVLRLLNK